MIHVFKLTVELESLNASLQMELDEEKQQNQFLQSTVDDMQRELKELEADNCKLKKSLSDTVHCWHAQFFKKSITIDT